MKIMNSKFIDFAARLIFLFSTFFFIKVGFGTELPGNSELSTMVDVFVSHDGFYPEYRIPALVTTGKGTLLAFAEGRQALSDHAQNDIVSQKEYRCWPFMELTGLRSFRMVRM